MDCFKKIDVFGGEINFSFKGERNHKTLLGGVCSLLMTLLLILFYTFKTIDFIGKLDPNISMVENFADEPSFDLYENGYRFAISSLDPSIGEVRAYSIRRANFENGRETGREIKEIPLVPCD